MIVTQIVSSNKKRGAMLAVSLLHLQNRTATASFTATVSSICSVTLRSYVPIPKYGRMLSDGSDTLWV